MTPCPFCGGVARIMVSDDEGNARSEEYEQDPWSGLTFKICHFNDENETCPIATHAEDQNGIGTFLYPSRDEAIQSWNTRATQDEGMR